MNQPSTRLISREEVAQLLTVDECITAVELAFRMHGEGKAERPGILGVPARDGGFHIKAGIMDLERPYFVAKTNANFPNNGKFALPTIQGVIVVCDAENGRLLALMDSIEITILRTGAATAVAAKYLSREDSKTVTICGAGNQGRVSLRMLSQIRPLENVFVYDIDHARSGVFADELSEELELEVLPVEDLGKATRKSDIVVTCTPSNHFLIEREHISEGTFIAAVGADNEDKQEIDPTLFNEVRVVTDITEQCMHIGELHHAIEKNLFAAKDVSAELGEIVAGKKPGRRDRDEIIIFDSTGMALQDVATSAVVYEKAIERQIGMTMKFS